MTKTEIAKKATSLVVGFGTAKIVKAIIRNNVKDFSKVTDVVAIEIAAYVLAMMVADSTEVWTDAKIDKLVTWWTENVKAKIPTKDTSQIQGP